MDVLLGNRAVRLGMRSEAHINDHGIRKGTWFLEDGPKIRALD